ncbi:DUF2848 domain-containing protein [Rhizobium sp. P32RR-XVIII]|uniref:DUF2848 domain-containing protein n=1 Tax=Rhizobium sp. P32RR-XVIII TaxID=2726738 RepID=UPI0039180654
MKPPIFSFPAVLHSGVEATHSEVGIQNAVVAGWTGRDVAAVEKHIAELEELGVKRPASTPIFYRVAATRLTTQEAVEVSGEDSSGEVEFVLMKVGGRIWVGVGSDHTDRKVETYSVTVSKQMCDKPISPEFWAYEDVAPHWDALVLRSYIVESGKRAVYQEGPVAGMLPPDGLLSRWNGGDLEDGTLMFGGTLAVHGGIRPSSRFEIEIEDPVRQRKISHSYDIITLPVAG